MNRKIEGFCLVSLVILLPLNIVSFTYPKYYTRITEISLYPDSHHDGYGMNFFFVLTVEIWNPQINSVALTTGNIQLLYSKSDVSFVNSSLSYVIGEIVSPAIRTHKLEPGLTLKNSTINLIIYGWNDSFLPEGLYIFWKYINASPESNNHLRTYLNVTQTNMTLFEDPLPKNWGKKLFFRSDWLFVTFSLSLILIGIVGFHFYSKFKAK